jgi:hypothetical protein
VTYVVQYRLVGLSPENGTSAKAGKPLKIGASLADASGARAALCTGCVARVQMFAVSGSGENDGPFVMSLHNGSGEYRYSWKSVRLRVRHDEDRGLRRLPGHNDGDDSRSAGDDHVATHVLTS